MMDFEFWWLLAFPVFFGLGWIAARIDIRQLLSETRRLPESYFQGLNFLVNEEADKAIEAFVGIAAVNPETIELQLALGKLFRRNGEVARAIRIHQNLLERDGLKPAERLLALRALGQDYRAAGLLDRAEEIFLRLKTGEHAEQATAWLLDIYAQEKEWAKAVECARWLDGRNGMSRAREMAHFHCELATQHLQDGNVPAARSAIEEAAHCDRRLPRPNLLLATLEAAANQPQAAIDALLRIESQSPAHLHLAAPALIDCCRQAGDASRGLRLVAGWLADHPGIDLLDVLYKATLDMQGAAAAVALVREHLRQHPTLAGLERLLAAQLLDTQGDRRQDLQLMHQLVRLQAERLSVYRCGACGFEAHAFHWQCPTCGGWDSIPPQRIDEAAARGGSPGQRRP